MRKIQGYSEVEGLQLIPETLGLKNTESYWKVVTICDYILRNW